MYDLIYIISWTVLAATVPLEVEESFNTNNGKLKCGLKLAALVLLLGKIII